MNSNTKRRRRGNIKRMKIKAWFLDVLKGASLGLGMIPGVSAGTMALIVGFYERMVDGIADLFKHFKKNFLDLLPLGIGAVISVIAIAIAVRYGFMYAPVAIVSLFAGVILGFMPLLTRETRGQKTSAGSISLIVVSFIVAASIGILSVVAKIYWHFDLSSAFEAGVWWIYILVVLAGFVAAAACIIPGISGSMILFVVGLYNPIIGLFAGDNSMFKNTDRLLSGLGLVACLLVGIVLGFISMSKIMKSLLDKHRFGTFDVVIGLVLGSVISMFANQEMVTDSFELIYLSTPVWEWIVAGVLLIGSGLGCFFLSKSYAAKADAKATNTELATKIED